MADVLALPVRPGIVIPALPDDASLPPWLYFDCAGATKRDPNALQSGAITFDGSANSIPMVGGAARGSIDDACTFYADLPANILFPTANGNPRQLLDVEVSFAAPPANLYGVIMGFCGVASGGGAAGLQRGSSTWLAYAAEGFGAVQGASDASASLARGAVWLYGVSGARRILATSIARTSDAVEIEGTTIADASLRLAATVVWRGAGAAAETITPIIKYRLIDLE